MQDRQCTFHNVILRQVRATNVTVGKQGVLLIAGKCIFIPFGTQREMRMRHISICDLSGFTIYTYIYFHIMSQTARISGGGLIEHKMCFDFLYRFYLKHFSSKKNLARYKYAQVFTKSGGVVYLRIVLSPEKASRM